MDNESEESTEELLLLQQPFYGSLDFVQENPYQKKHSPTHTYRGHQSSLICFIHLLRSLASFLFNLHAWQSFSTISLQVFFGLPLGLTPSSSYFNRSLSSFCSKCPYHSNLFCSTEEVDKKIDKRRFIPMWGRYMHRQRQSEPKRLAWCKLQSAREKVSSIDPMPEIAMRFVM